MKKIVLLSVFTVFMFATSVAFANVPNTNYDRAGKGAASISFSRSDVDTDVKNFRNLDFDSAWNFGAKAEMVIAPKWAVGFNYMCSKSDKTKFNGGIFKAEASLTTFELTAQYMAY